MHVSLLHLEDVQLLPGDLRELRGALRRQHRALLQRTGADEATTLNTPGDLMVGRIHVPAGTYSLFTIPGEKEWTLVLNKMAKQWGAFKYDESQDLGRTTMKLEKLAQPVEQLTITIVPGSGNQGSLRIAWENTAAVAPIMVH